jgi:DNA modification methylase
MPKKPAKSTPTPESEPPAPARTPAQLATPVHSADDPRTEVYVGDCREVIAALRPKYESKVDLIFADPPFNWKRAYDEWNDSMLDDDYLTFTREWLDACITLLAPDGSFWVNIPDDWAAEIVVHLKQRHLTMVNWCIWHYRFGQNTTQRFINSKVHALYFSKSGSRTWNPDAVLEPSDRATTYFDPRTLDKKDGMPAGKRVPMDVWYGQYWGRIQGNNKERRAYHDNQLPEVYLERVVRSSSNQGHLVMDPFLGSGTTGVVARNLNRRFIGIEYSPANALSSFNRILEGPTRPLGQALGESSAIFAPRNTGSKTQKRFALNDAAQPSLLPLEIKTIVRNGKRIKADRS